MNNAFFTFIKPVLAFVDDGRFFRRPFSWLYLVLAILNLILPIYILVTSIDNNVFDMSGGAIVTFFLVWLVLVFTCWLGFQLWWDRSSIVSRVTKSDEDYIATPVFSHFIQTAGEWLGLFYALVGFAFALFATIIIGDNATILSMRMDLGFLDAGIENIILKPVYGFLLVVVFRVIAEIFRALTAIANNTKRGEKHVKV